MSNLPMHPAIVHLPLGLAVLLPLIAITFCIAIWRGWLPAKSWVIVTALHLILFGSALLAMKTGEREEERVEEVVGESALESHEEMGEIFAWASGITLLITGGAMFFRKKNLGFASRAGASLGLITVAGLALATGHSGGALVYQKGAASAYVEGQNPEGGNSEGRGVENKNEKDD